MKALLLIAHGSKNQNSNDEICDLLEAFKATRHGFEILDYAFLELSEPDIATAIKSLVGLGASEIKVLPYFLAKGNHIARDIPEKVSDVQNTYPDIPIDILPHIGASTKMLNLLLELVSTHTH